MNFINMSDRIDTGEIILYLHNLSEDSMNADFYSKLNSQSM